MAGSQAAKEGLPKSATRASAWPLPRLASGCHEELHPHGKGGPMMNPWPAMAQVMVRQRAILDASLWKPWLCMWHRGAVSNRYVEQSPVSQLSQSDRHKNSCILFFGNCKLVGERVPPDECRNATPQARPELMRRNNCPQRGATTTIAQ